MESIGPYRILGELGRGGMGVVYRSLRTDLDREFALKVVLPGAEVTAELLARMRREAQAAASLAGHPGIVGVHDVGEHDGRLYLAMDFVQGPSLSAVVQEGELTPAAAAEIMAHIARAMEHAHDHGVVHRDLKPANVLVPEDGPPRVADFGLARIRQADPEVTRLTQSGEILGTPAYMAPEQVRGETAGPAADIYALGAMLHELLAGTPPFGGDSIYGVLAKVLKDPPPELPSHVPDELRAISERCLEKSPGDRYLSAGALAEDLERFGRGDAIAARRVGGAGRALRSVRRKPLVVAAAVAALAAGGIGIGLTGQWSRAADEADASASGTRVDREATEQIQALASAYATVVLQSGGAMSTLEDAWQGAAIPPARIPQLLARIRQVTAQAGESRATALPEAWLALARFFAGEEDAALDALAAAVARAPGDPFPPILLARAHLARYAKRADVELYSVGRAMVETGDFQEDADMEAWRVAADRHLRAALAMPALQGMGAARGYQNFALGSSALGTGDPKTCSDRLAPLADDPVLGAPANALRAVALFAQRRRRESAQAWEQVAERGWPHAAAKAARAWLTCGAGAIGANDDPMPLLERAVSWFDRALAGGTLAERSLVMLHRGVAIDAVAEQQAIAGGDPRLMYEAAITAFDAIAGSDSASATAASANAAGVFISLAQYEGPRGIDPLPRYAEALRRLDTLLTSRPEYAFAHLRRARVHVELGSLEIVAGRDPTAHLQAAVAGAETAISLANTEVDAHSARGEAFKLLAIHRGTTGGDAGAAFRESLNSYDRWLAGLEAPAPHRRLRGNTRRRYADWRNKQGEDPIGLYRDALDDLAAARAVDAQIAPIAVEQGSAHFGLGQWALTRQNLDEARAAFALARTFAREAIAADERFALAWNLLARVALFESDSPLSPDDASRAHALRAAATAAKTAARHDPRAVAARLNWANSLYRLAPLERRLGQDPLPACREALTAFAEVLAMQPRHYGALYSRAILFERLGRLDEAEQAFVQVTNAHPDRPLGQQGLARVRERRRTK